MANESLETVAPDEGVPNTGNVPEAEYNSKGQTTVATRRGYRFASSDKEVPVVTSAGIKVTSAVADALVKESDGLVHVVKEGE